MKKIASLIFICIFFWLGLIGCNNFQSSSKEEALYTLKQRADYKELVQYLSIRSWSLSPYLTRDPYVFDSDPQIFTAENWSNKEQGFSSVHYVIYKTKESIRGIKRMENTENCLVILNDDRPPKVVVEKYF